MSRSGRETKSPRSENTKLWYVNLALFIGLLVVILATQRSMTMLYRVGAAPLPLMKKVSRPVKSFRGEGQEANGNVKEPYDIDAIKKSMSGQKALPEELSDVYKKHSVKDAGRDVVQAWANVAPADKQKLIVGLDESIKKAETDLKVNPDDEKAESLLKVSKMLKKVSASGFNIKFDKTTIEELKKAEGSGK